MTVRGTPDRTARLTGGKWLFNLRSEERLIVLAPRDELPKNPDQMLQGDFSGQLRDMSETGWVDSHMPNGAMADFARQDLGLKSTADVRVLDLGTGTGEARFEEIAGFVFSPCWGIAGLALLYVTFVRRRRKA